LKKNLLIITGSRAESGILSTLYKELKNSNRFNLSVLATGVHPSISNKNYSDLLTENIDFKLDIDLPSKVNNVSITKSISKGLQLFPEIIQSNNIDIIIVLGDRYELLPFVISARFFDKHIIHFHGGEVTKGAFDDWIRHSISKMSNIHFVANKEYRKRLIKMGESPDTVFEVGSLALDDIELNRSFKSPNVENFCKNYKNQFVLVTQHPETSSDITIEDQVEGLTRLLNNSLDRPFLITSSNSDPGGYTINNILKKISKNRKNILFVENLGRNDYLCAINHCRYVLGNSSSALVEVPALDKISFNIGTRQDGRLFANTVINLNHDFNDNLEDIFHNFKTKNQYKPYGRGGAVKKVLKIMEEYNFNKSSTKEFYDG